MKNLPTGTVTFLFTDIEGSTELLQRLGDRRYAQVLADHQRLLRAAFEKGNGQEIDTQGDAFLVAFSRARDALAAAVAAQRALTKHLWPDGASLQVRMGLHTGEPISNAQRYVGLDVHRAARIGAAGHGGQILLSDAVSGLASRDLPPGVSLRDLGTHRLKDLREPEHLFQVVHSDLATDFPPLKSLEARPNNLPIQLTSFIGREQEIAEVRRLLNATRLVTLTGSGGAGKTRLALQIAADVLDGYPEGVWLAELAPIADPALVPKTVASVVNVPEQPGRDMTETLVDALRPKTLLLVLDNCEHLLGACRELAVALLRSCPQVRILATSREGLGVPGETLWRVPSLSLPDAHTLPSSEDLVQYEAVRLFVDRAVSATPGFAVTTANAPAVAQVCHQLDGIPLAIELAAARVKVLAVEQIVSRLDDRFRLLTGGSRVVLPRQQTLRAAIDWSYNLLSEPEQVLLRRLAVFAGGWTLEAAESVCAGGDIEVTSILDFLTSLVDKSLVLAETQQGEARYRLLETVRQYAHDRLSEAGEEADVRARHRDCYLALAEQAWPGLFGPHSGLWMERLETEHDNMRAALEQSKTDPHGAEPGLRLAGALIWFWIRHGDWREARQWLAAALARSAEAPPAALPRALAGMAQLAWRFDGDYEMAETLAERGLTVCRQLGDTDDRNNKETAAVLLFQWGVAVMRRGDSTRATTLFDQCLTLCTELGHKWIEGHALAGLGQVAQYTSADYERAKALFTESLAWFREVGDSWGIAYGLRNLGLVGLYQNDYEPAAAFLKESLALCKAIRETWLSEECVTGLAWVSCAGQHYERAARLFGAADVARDALGWHPDPSFQAYHERYVASTRAALGDMAFATAYAEGRVMTLEQAIEYALTTEPG